MPGASFEWREPRSVLRRTFVHDGHGFEVLLDRGPPWDGMVHILDAEMERDPDNLTDVVLTGGRFCADCCEVHLDAADVRRPISSGLLEAAAKALRLALAD